MPIYEYQALHPRKGCKKCRDRFEFFQGIKEEALLTCPCCGKKIKKIISWCRSAVTEISEEDINVERQVKKYERSGMWSHAAELADTHSEKTQDTGLKTRALENYKKAGYDADSLEKHAKTDKE